MSSWTRRTGRGNILPVVTRKLLCAGGHILYLEEHCSNSGFKVSTLTVRCESSFYPGRTKKCRGFPRTTSAAPSSRYLVTTNHPLLTVSTLGSIQGLVLRDQFVPDLVLSRRAGLRQEGGTPSSDHLTVSFFSSNWREESGRNFRQLSCFFDYLKF